jgi:RNA polymerase sigma-70 factor (ECF subfamily)
MRRKRLNALIRRAIAGDAVAVEQLCQLYAKTILFQTQLLVRNKDDAEDVAQRVAIEMLRGIQKLKSSYAFRSWLQRLIVSACAKQNAQQLRDSERIENLEFAEAVIDDSPEGQPEDEMVSKDMRRFVGGYLAKLPPAQAITLTMYYYEQLSYKEIAAALEISLGSVASTIAKAKKNLKRLMKENNEQNVLGIQFTAPFLRGNVEKTVCDEVEFGVPPDAVERFMGTCRVKIPGIFSEPSTIASVAVGGWRTAVTVLVGFVLLGGLGAIATLIAGEVTIPESPPPQKQEEITVTEPESRVTYSVAREQFHDDPTNPLTAQIELLSDERILRWDLVDSQGKTLATGLNDFLDIAALELADGDYTLNWFLVNKDGVDSRVFWEFSINSNID